MLGAAVLSRSRTIAVWLAPAAIAFAVARNIGEARSATTTSDRRAASTSESSVARVARHVRAIALPAPSTKLAVVLPPRVETAEERDRRHQRIAASIAQTLGDISQGRLDALLELHDENAEMSYRLQNGLLEGSLTHDDYLVDMHDEVADMAVRLRELVGDDDYRKLMKIEPGVDPFDYARTGVGRAADAPDDVAIEPDPSFDPTTKWNERW